MILNIELTSRCNKNCWMCGRRKIDRDYPDIQMNYGDMDFNLVKRIATQIPDETLIQFHNNGEPLLYPYLNETLKLFEGKIRCFDTNGVLLANKEIQDALINNMESLTLSTFQDDPEWEQQYENLLNFLMVKGERKPQVIIRVLGNIGEERLRLYKKTGCLLAYRILHSPMGSFDYEKQPVIPEHGICLEMLNHPVINRLGEFSVCVRFDPHKDLVIGNIGEQTFDEIWNGEKRKKMLAMHLQGERNLIPFCSKCEFWGIPRG